MVLPLSLAMTARELSAVPQNSCAYMACHFSGQDSGLSNCPDTLPPDSILIIDDSIPPENHDMANITQQLGILVDALQIKGILLDFQRPNIASLHTLIHALLDAAFCCVAVSAQYAEDLPCAVFLPPPPLHRPLKDYLKPWRNRDIWLEAALSCGKFQITPQGSQFYDDVLPPVQNTVFQDDALHCSYQTQLSQNQADIFLWRTPGQLQDLLNEAASLGVSRAVGLYQELGKDFCIKDSG